MPQSLPLDSRAPATPCTPTSHPAIAHRSRHPRRSNHIGTPNLRSPTPVPLFRPCSHAFVSPYRGLEGSALKGRYCHSPGCDISNQSPTISFPISDPTPDFRPPLPPNSGSAPHPPLFSISATPVVARRCFLSYWPGTRI